MTTLLAILLWITGIDSIQADWMRERYHRSELIHYLEAMDDHTIVETHTTGGWTTSERKEFSVEGIGYTQNRYYIDGFRVDDKFQPGSSRYIPNMQAYNLQMNYHTAQMYFSLNGSSSSNGLNGDYLEVSGNFGGLNNEPAAGTAALIHLFHRTPMESADTWKHVTARRHIRGAGSMDGAYTIRGYRQHVSAGYGSRVLTKEDQNGPMTEDPTYNAQYYYVQADGRLPWGLNYMLHFAGRDDGGSENLYNYGEVYQHKVYTGSIYWSSNSLNSLSGSNSSRFQVSGFRLTTGLTWATNTVRHEDPNFSKNIIDQDGESFEPWMPDGDTHELTWNLTAEKPLLKWLRLVVDASNSMLYFKPTRTEWSNTVYLEAPNGSNSLNGLNGSSSSIGSNSLYPYTWHTRAYASGLMENSIGLQADYAAHKYVDIHGTLNLTLDGMLLGHGKSKVSPNIEAAFRMEVHPCKWFQMGVAVGHYRQAYTAEQMRYFSHDYMYTDDGHGGKYHEYQKGLKQTAYALVDLPIVFQFTSKRGIHHEFSLQQSAKKFYHVWYTYADASLNSSNSSKVQGYEVGYTPTCGSSFFTNTPYYFSQLTKYTLESKHVTFSIGWQSMLAAGYSALGNGANSNNNGVLSESTALASTSQVITNPNAERPGVGRLDMDKGFVCRIYIGYNICKWVQVGLNLKWTDGKPFTAYRYAYANASLSSSNGSRSLNGVIITPLSSRGTNPTDGNFGTRYCANWQADLHVQGCWWIKGNKKQTLRVEAYNVWDFACDQAEMCFYQDIPQARRSSIILNVPTGLLVTFKTEL